ncbi:MAG: oligosaccharide flippase family protein [Enterococcaceae bacterium]|jgi:O-antigen/teichoic acid export membrane protein|nr:oligosaccharide flippase family protein [Enterococcaceae bacterium]
MAMRDKKKPEKEKLDPLDYPTRTARLRAKQELIEKEKRRKEEEKQAKKLAIQQAAEKKRAEKARQRQLAIEKKAAQKAEIARQKELAQKRKEARKAAEERQRQIMLAEQKKEAEKKRQLEEAKRAEEARRKEAAEKEKAAQKAEEERKRQAAREQRQAERERIRQEKEEQAAQAARERQRALEKKQAEKAAAEQEKERKKAEAAAAKHAAQIQKEKAAQIKKDQLVEKAAAKDSSKMPEELTETREEKHQSAFGSWKEKRKNKEDDSEEKYRKMTQGTPQEKMVRGTAWLTAGNILSRLLGAAYIIPWYIWMGSNGDTANALFGKGYNVYALFLMISTAGIPAAIAKQIAHYNSLEEYDISFRLFKQTMKLMAIVGVAFTLIMYFAAPILAAGNQDLIPVMQSLSIALLLFPCMSVIRGFFQGNHDMMPYAMSQIIEQVARVFYMLASAYVIMRVMKGSYVSAVVQSTFAAFVGMIFAVLLLLFYLWKQRAIFHHQKAISKNVIHFSANELIVQMIKEAIPFIIVGSGTSIFRLIDQYSFEKTMTYISHYSAKQLEQLFALFAANPDKLTMVVIAIATSLATAGLPLITETFTKKDRRSLAKLVGDNFQLFFFVMLPAIVGMIILAFPLNTLFYKADGLGTALLIESCIAGIMMGLFMLSSTTLQGLNGNKSAVGYLVFGIVVKCLLQIPAILAFEVYGPLFATFIGFLVANILIIGEIHQISQFSFRQTVRVTGQICGMTLFMSVFAVAAKYLGMLILSPERKTQAFLLCIFVAVIGGFAYLWIALKNRLADKLLGDRVGGLRAKLRIK